MSTPTPAELFYQGSQWTPEELAVLEAHAAARGMPVTHVTRDKRDKVEVEFPWSEVDRPSLRVLAWHSFVMQGRAIREDFERTYGAESPTTLFLTRRMVRFTLRDPTLEGPQ